MKKPIPIIIFLTAAALLLSGCGINANYRSIERLLTVEALGLDAAAGGVVLSAATGSAGGAPLLLRRGGDSLLSAMEQLQDYADAGQLFFAHTRFLVLGEDYARAGLAPLLDYVERDMHLRTGVLLAVVREQEASALLTAERSGDAASALTAAERDAETRGDSRFTGVRELARDLAEDGAALVCALELRPAEGSVFPEGEGLAVVPAGYAVVRGAALAGYLTGDTARCASLLLGHPGQQRRTVEAAGGRYVLELDAAETKLAPVYAGGAGELRGAGGAEDELTLCGTDGALAGLELRVTLRFAVAERLEPMTAASDTDAAEELCAALEAEIGQEIAAVLAASREYDADFLRLGRALRKHGAELVPAERDGGDGGTGAQERNAGDGVPYGAAETFGEGVGDGLRTSRGPGCFTLQTLPVRVTLRAVLDRGGDISAPVGTGGTT